jgi:hypothetical protein
MAGLGGMVPRGLSGDRVCVLMDARWVVAMYGVVVASTTGLARSLL